MWLDPNNVAYFQDQATRHGAIVLESLPVSEERFVTASGVPYTNLLVARTTGDGYALLVSEDLTPRQPALADFFRDTPVEQGWRLLALPAYASFEEALQQAGRLLGLEADTPATSLHDSPPAASVQPEAPASAVRVPGANRSEEGSRRPTQAKPEFTHDLTEAARRGDLATIEGRNREMEEVLTILLQQGKNCPLLVGEPGVGKTAVAEKLAQHAAGERLPAPLRNLRVFALDLPALLTASGQKGGLEGNIRVLFDSLEAHPDWLLFVDEIHALADIRGDIALFDMLKPRLTQGLRLMGATTHREFQEKIARDAAMVRRFAPVRVDEPTPEETTTILQARLPALQAHHQVAVSAEMVAEIVRLADEYFPSLFRPDKALTLLDRAMATEALKGHQVTS